MQRRKKVRYSITASARGEQRRRHGEPERLGGLEIDHQLELDRGLDGKLARLFALEDAIGIGRRAPKIIDAGHFRRTAGRQFQ